MKAVVAAFNQKKALVGAFSVITNLRIELFEALVVSRVPAARPPQSAANSIIHGIILNQFCQKYFCDTLLHREAMRHQAARRGWQI